MNIYRVQAPQAIISLRVIDLGRLPIWEVNTTWINNDATEIQDILTVLTTEPNLLAGRYKKNIGGLDSLADVSLGYGSG